MESHHVLRPRLLFRFDFSKTESRGRPSKHLNTKQRALSIERPKNINTFCGAFPAGDSFIWGLTFNHLLLILAHSSCPQRRKPESQHNEHLKQLYKWQKWDSDLLCRSCVCLVFWFLLRQSPFHHFSVFLSNAVTWMSLFPPLNFWSPFA